MNMAWRALGTAYNGCTPPTMLRVGDVKTFENFVVTLPAGVDLTKYAAVVVRCEAFGEFITAAKYQ